MDAFEYSEYLFEQYKKQKEAQYKKYCELYSIAENSSLSAQKWYTDYVLFFPCFNFKVPPTLLNSDFHWNFLLTLLQASFKYELIIKIEDIKLHNNSDNLPELIYKKPYNKNELKLVELNQDNINELVIDLISDLTEVYIDIHDSNRLPTKHKIQRCGLQVNYWNIVAEKIRSRQEMAGIISTGKKFQNYFQ